MMTDFGNQYKIQSKNAYEKAYTYLSLGAPLIEEEAPWDRGIIKLGVGADIGLFAGFFGVSYGLELGFSLDLSSNKVVLVWSPFLLESMVLLPVVLSRSLVVSGICFTKENTNDMGGRESSVFNVGVSFINGASFMYEIGMTSFDEVILLGEDRPASTIGVPIVDGAETDIMGSCQNQVKKLQFFKRLLHLFEHSQLLVWV